MYEVALSATVHNISTLYYNDAHTPYFDKFQWLGNIAAETIFTEYRRDLKIIKIRDAWVEKFPHLRNNWDMLVSKSTTQKQKAHKNLADKAVAQQPSIFFYKRIIKSKLQQTC